MGCGQRDGGEPGEQGEGPPIPGYVYELCRALRRKGTPTEELLREALRDRRLGGLKFRRQHPLGRHVADFSCVARRLVIEVDGAVHRRVDRAEYGRVRDEALRARGLSLLRVTNGEVANDLEGVLATIVSTVSATATSPHPRGRFAPAPPLHPRGEGEGPKGWG